jgi:hypothetical protein
MPSYGRGQQFDDAARQLVPGNLEFPSGSCFQTFLAPTGANVTSGQVALGWSKIKNPWLALRAVQSPYSVPVRVIRGKNLLFALVSAQPSALVSFVRLRVIRGSILRELRVAPVELSDVLPVWPGHKRSDTTGGPPQETSCAEAHR